MFKRKKKKTGCETPELRKPTPPRAYKLNHGDVFVLNDVAIEQTFNMPIKRIRLGETINQCFICTEKIKRHHWWQFWKPKYWGAKFMYVEKETTK
jgi:hypothetical protein